MTTKTTTRVLSKEEVHELIKSRGPHFFHTAEESKKTLRETLKEGFFMAKLFGKTVWNTTVGPIIGLIMGLLGCLLAYKRHSLSVYHNPVYQGDKLKPKAFVQLFKVEQKHLEITVDEGKLAVIHGIPDGFVSGNEFLNHYEMAQKFSDGDHILVSCYNGFHKDVITPFQKFVRDENTITEYPSFIGLLFGSILIVYSNKIAAKGFYLSNTRLWPMLK